MCVECVRVECVRVYVCIVCVVDSGSLLSVCVRVCMCVR